MKIPVKLKDNETELQTMVEAFEELFDNIPPIKILGYSHYDLHKNTGLFSPTEWKRFLTDERIVEWYKTERSMMLRAQTMSFLEKLSQGKMNTGDATILGKLLESEDDEQDAEADTIFVYSFIPLTEEERGAPNVKILDSVPTQIKDSLQISRTGDKK